MNSELTNVYSIMKKEFKEELEYFNLEDNRELASFLHYNTHNEMFIDTDEYYYHNVNFKNLDTGKESRAFREGFIYFFPKGSDLISANNNLTAFSIGKGIKCIKTNSNGLFIENNDLKGNIITEYYDTAALNEISNKGLAVGNIDYIEDHIQSMGINPDKVISVSNKDGNLNLSVTENGEIVNQYQTKIGEDRTIYSTYFEFMKINDYYGPDKQQFEISNMHI